MEEKDVVVYDPGKSLELQKVGSGLFKSGLFPNAKNEFGAYAIVQYGAELGIGPMMSLKNINIISGQVACNAQLMLTLALKKGVTYEVLEESDKGAKIKFKRGGAEYTASFVKADADAAGLSNKDNWKKYPRDMYFWRAVAKGVRRIAPDAVMGLYTAEEISEGSYIDIREIPTVEPEKQKEAKVLTTEEMVAGLKANLASLMTGMKKDEKADMYLWMTEGHEVTVDFLQECIDTFAEKRSAYDEYRKGKG